METTTGTTFPFAAKVGAALGKYFAVTALNKRGESAKSNVVQWVLCP
jgi:hypothetical protein